MKYFTVNVAPRHDDKPLEIYINGKQDPTAAEWMAVAGISPRVGVYFWGKNEKCAVGPWASMSEAEEARRLYIMALDDESSE